MNLQKLESLLPKQIEDLSLKAEIDGAEVCRLWHEYADQFFLSQTMQNHEAINFRDGVLTIIVNNPELAKEIGQHQHQIIIQINRTLGKPLVGSVHFRS